MKVRGDQELRHLIFGDMHLTPLQMHFLWNILMVLFLHQVQPVVVIHGICWYIPVIVSKVGIQPNH